MFKAKKILLFLICVSPLIAAVVFGYPVSTKQEKLVDGFMYTKRCFKVGELPQFIRCYSPQKAVKGLYLLSDLQRKTSSLFPFFDVLFFASLAVISVLILLI